MAWTGRVQSVLHVCVGVPGMRVVGRRQEQHQHQQQRQVVVQRATSTSGCLIIRRRAFHTTPTRADLLERIAACPLRQAHLIGDDVRGLRDEVLGGAELSHVERWRGGPTSGSVVSLVRRVYNVGNADRLVHSLAHYPEGIELLIRMREQLMHWDGRGNDELEGAAVSSDEAEARARLYAAVRNRLGALFVPALMRAVAIDERCDGGMLEIVHAHGGAVHAMPTDNGSAFFDRIAGANKLTFGLVHAALGSLPVAFVETAITASMASQVAPLLRGVDEADSDRGTGIDDKWAMFYSIVSPIDALRGISLGNHLLAAVIGQLRQAGRASRFATLSPVPTLSHFFFSKYVGDHPADGAVVSTLMEDAGVKLAASLEASRLLVASPEGRAIVERACVEYLVRVKRSDGCRARDPVAHFHYSNGARLARVNCLADTSDKGLTQSFGVMVNYEYVPAAMAANAAGYRVGDVACVDEYS